MGAQDGFAQRGFEDGLHEPNPRRTGRRDAAPAAAPAETQVVAAPVEPAAANAPEPSPAHSPAGAPDVGSTSEPHPAVPLTEGSGRA